nr:MBL fold metallo-hydrolase [Bacteroidales bacterium]
MQLTVLTENVAGGYYSAEHGLSYFIEFDNKKILFDTGHSDIFLKNAKLLKINLYEVETLVLSHGHWDHGNGLKYIENKKLICHPDSFMKRYRKNDNSYIGLDLSYDELKKKFEIIVSRKAYKISENMFFLGEIPRLNSFEAQTTSFINEKGNDDFVPDDSAIVINSPKGLIIVTGCGHAGICNTIEYAKNITGNNNVYAVIGGFHLKKADIVTKKVIEYFKKEKIEKIYPSHCNELTALAEFYKNFNINQV